MKAKPHEVGLDAEVVAHAARHAREQAVVRTAGERMAGGGGGPGGLSHVQLLEGACAR